MTDRAFLSVREVAELLGIRQHGVTSLIKPKFLVDSARNRLLQRHLWPIRNDHD